jgi:hypothetical protein
MKYSTRVVLQMTDQIGEYILIEKDAYDFDGQPDLCCGPSSQEETEANATEGFTNTLMGNYAQLFGNQQTTLQNLNAEIGKIQSGQQTPGFSGGPSNGRRVRRQRQRWRQRRAIRSAN